MKRSDLNFLIDFIAFVGFVLMTTTGVLMRYLLPPGSGHYSTIWGLDRHEWGGVHFWISLVFFSVLAIHLVLHWRWIVTVATGRPREGSGVRAGLGAVGVTTVLALSVSPLLMPVEKGATGLDSTPFSSHPYEDISIRGSMSLQEIQDTTGVPAMHIVEALNLPRSTHTTERLGNLKRQFGFEINDVREIVKNYKDAE